MEQKDQVYIPFKKAYRSKTTTDTGRSLRNHYGQKERQVGEIKADRKAIYRRVPNRAN